MAKVTWTYIEESFYQQFARMQRPEQHGIITGLRAIMLSGTCGQVPEERVEVREPDLMAVLKDSLDATATGDLFEEEAPAQ
jgi:hypothetical protein